jgi:carbamate kinase
VDAVYLHFNTPNQTPIQSASCKEMENWLREGHFLEGSMKPKVEAAIDFLKGGGQRVVIAQLNDLLQALQGKSGTQIHP